MRQTIPIDTPVLASHVNPKSMTADDVEQARLGAVACRAEWEQTHAQFMVGGVAQ